MGSLHIKPERKPLRHLFNVQLNSNPNYLNFLRCLCTFSSSQSPHIILLSTDAVTGLQTSAQLTS